MNFQQYAVIPEENQAEFYLTLAAAAQRKCYKGKHFSWVDASPSCWPNAIFRANIPLKLLEPLIPEMMNDIRNNQLPAHWIAGAGSRPDILEEVLLMQGFELRKSDAAMVFDADTTRLPEARTGEMTIIRPEAVQMMTWAELVVVNLLRGPLHSCADFRDLLVKILDHKQFAVFAGILGDRMVATAMVFLGRNSAGIYYVAVDSNYRKMGLGRQITQAAMQYAGAHGHRLLALHATDAGRVIYDKLGFQEYGRLRFYAYPLKRK